MDTEHLIQLYPRLYHMATAGGWPSIEANGLWTTEQIATSAGLHDNDIDAILRQRRPQTVSIDHPVLGSVDIRDQKPLKLGFLEDSLTDLTVEEWLETLNNRVFFWLHEERLDTLLGARPYRNTEHDVLTIDTRALLEAHYDNVRLSPMNSGATLFPSNLTRGTDTFSRVHDFNYESRRGRPLPNRVVELAVIEGVHDLGDHVLNVQRRRGAEIIDEYRIR
jgi:hypothetical protein